MKDFVLKLKTSILPWTLQTKVIRVILDPSEDNSKKEKEWEGKKRQQLGKGREKEESRPRQKFS